jgi:putative aminopeptidase FrvX
MVELLPLLKTLLSASGLSGFEAPVRALIEEAWRPLVDEVSVSQLGSLHALRRGTGAEPRPRILLAAHMDAIGLMVSQRVDGFLRVTSIGGIDARVLPGQLVTVHGREELAGVIAMPPGYLLPPGRNDYPPVIEDLIVDTGLEVERVAALVRVGDLVSFARQPLELSGGALSGHSLDNRASVVALTGFLQELQSRTHSWDVIVAATAQEEETLGGAQTSAFQLKPDLAVAVDVTYGKGPGAVDYNTFPLDSGPTIGWGPNIHPAVHRRFLDAAARLEIPYSREIMPRHSGTDAYSMQVAAAGTPTMVVGIPLRYMHMPVETVVLKDIERAGRLLAEFVTGLEPDFIESITWDV